MDILSRTPRFCSRAPVLHPEHPGPSAFKWRSLLNIPYCWVGSGHQSQALPGRSAVLLWIWKIQHNTGLSYAKVRAKRLISVWLLRDCCLSYSYLDALMARYFKWTIAGSLGRPPPPDKNDAPPATSMKDRHAERLFSAAGRHLTAYMKPASMSIALFGSYGSGGPVARKGTRQRTGRIPAGSQAWKEEIHRRPLTGS